MEARMLGIDRRTFIASLGGTAAIALMDYEARADALEDYSIEQLDAAVANAQGAQQPTYPTVAELEAQIENRTYRRGVGSLFMGSGGTQKVKRLPPMPE